MAEIPDNKDDIHRRLHRMFIQYPVMWQGHLVLKNDHSTVKMHCISGNSSIARSSLPPIVDETIAPVRILHRMRLEAMQLDSLLRKLQILGEHCILIAVPCGKDPNDLIQQSNNMKTRFMRYFMSKNVAGIVNITEPGANHPSYTIHIFSTCEFIESYLAGVTPNLLQLIQAGDIPHLVIIICST